MLNHYRTLIPSSTILTINSTKITHIVTDICFHLPLNALINTNDNIPNIIPCAILNANGIITIVRNAGSASDISSKLILTTEVIINKPTSIKAGAVADAGTIKKMGARKSARANIIAVERAVKPVLPPTATPDALSTYEVTVLVPNIAPKVVPSASAKRAFFICGKLPFLSAIPILDARSEERRVGKECRCSGSTDV